MTAHPADQFERQPATFADAQRAKVKRILEVGLKVLFEDYGPRALLERKGKVATCVKDAKHGKKHVVTLDKRGVLTVRVNNETTARSLPLGFSTCPLPDPKFKPPRWLV